MVPASDFFVLNLYFALGIIAGVDLLTRARHFGTVRRVLATGLATASIAVLSIPTVTAARTATADLRANSYLAVSDWVRTHTRAEESIASLEIGYFGYYTDNHIVDLAGLIHPESVPHIAAGDFAWTFWHYEPDYYLYLPDFDWALASIRTDPQFVEQYEPIATLAGPRTTDFVVYKRHTHASDIMQSSQTEDMRHTPQ